MRLRSAHDMARLENPRAGAQFWTAPNQITLLRLLFIPFVIIAVFDAHWRWALALLIAAAVSDALDGLLARTLHQQTLLGLYLDPIADKMLLSSLFLVLSFVKKIPWKYTVVVFTRDIGIVMTAIVFYAAVGFRDFRPSIFGKINTFCQIATVWFVVLAQVVQAEWLTIVVKLLLYATFTFTSISAAHYALLMGQRLRKEHLKTVASSQ
jgi:cardiolipin synthase